MSRLPVGGHLSQLGQPQRPWVLPFPEVQDSGERRFRVAGVDLGQSHDYAAVAVLERVIYEGRFIGPPNPLRIAPNGKPTLACIKLMRWPRGTDYTVIERDCAKLPVDVIALEYNGVGQPVFDNVRQECRKVGFPGQVLGVLHTGGQLASTVRTEGRRGGRRRRVEKQVWYVPKASMVSSLEIVQQTGELILLPAVGEGLEQLKHELENYRTRIGGRGHKSYGNVPGADEHDDLVVALGIACYLMRHLGQRTLDGAIH